MSGRTDGEGLPAPEGPALMGSTGDSVATRTSSTPAVLDRTTVGSHLKNILVEIDLVDYLGG